jgi:hypothetical protein
MSRRNTPAADRVAPQFDLFPEPLQVERLDPRRVGGAQTRVQGVYLVRRRASAPVHRVFHDRHGWYCEEHGAQCPLVAEVRREVGAVRSA